MKTLPDLDDKVVRDRAQLTLIILGALNDRETLIETIESNCGDLEQGTALNQKL